MSDEKFHEFASALHLQSQQLSCSAKRYFIQNQYFNMKRFSLYLFCDSIFSMKNSFTRSMHSIYFSHHHSQAPVHFSIEKRLKLLLDAMIQRVNLY